jgi:hypothetical protein
MLTYSRRLGADDQDTDYTPEERIAFAVEFIQAGRKDGDSDDKIKQDLAASGNDEATIAAAFARVGPAPAQGGGGGGGGKPWWFWPLIIGGGAVAVGGAVVAIRR